MKPAETPPSGWIEFAPRFQPRPGLRVALFDLDGTLSLLRSGWADVMVDLYAEALAPLTGETPEARRQLAFQDIMQLNGRQTLHQMIRLTERIAERGGLPQPPQAYKQEFLRRLNLRLTPRKEAIRTRQTEADSWLVPGARAFLQYLRTRGFDLYLASGTDEALVQEESQLLQIQPFFTPPLYGARDEHFTKAAAIDEILRRTGVTGQQLLCFGDGPVEIQNTKAVGGVAIGLVGIEKKPWPGQPDPWKRQQLLEAGADALIVDYRAAQQLLQMLLGENSHTPHKTGSS
ncbi:MAG: HAD hydrolase-like protein [Verrucomicrobiota bacterium]|nr:HAD hydrolase-like protein [Limisphaera sp.]MDW8383052.1 HAD hydrolase-like protein [Verrucomicrobiota bacterium]